MTTKAGPCTPSKGMPAALVLALAGAFIAAALMLRVFVEDWAWDRKAHGWKRANIFKVWVALEQYSRDHGGVYPYDANGADRALYLLKPYVKSARIFDSHSADKDINGKAWWDDKGKRLVSADYDYINLPQLHARAEWRYLVVIAEKTGVKAGGKAYVTLGGRPGFYLYGADLPQDIIGGMLFPIADP